MNKKMIVYEFLGENDGSRRITSSDPSVGFPLYIM